MEKINLYLSATFVLLYLSLILLFTSCNPKRIGNADEKSEDKTESKYHLVWQDEFNYTGLPDSTKWKYDTEGNDSGWGNHEAQYYTGANEKNAHVTKGVLHITARKENFDGKEYTSARLVSKADWKYGKFVVRAKLPKANGTWSAIWMMPGDWTYKDGNWPDVGEIDIMEHVGHDLGVIHASAHSKDYQWQEGTQKTATIHIPKVDEEFHNYGLEWSQEVLTVFVDDSLYFEYQNEGLGESKWPYIKPFHLILNIALGGVWGGEIDDSAFPQTMEVDYVRVYQKDILTEKE